MTTANQDNKSYSNRKSTLVKKAVLSAYSKLIEAKIIFKHAAETAGVDLKK